MPGVDTSAPSPCASLQDFIFLCPHFVFLARNFIIQLHVCVELPPRASLLKMKPLLLRTSGQETIAYLGHLTYLGAFHLSSGDPEMSPLACPRQDLYSTHAKASFVIEAERHQQRLFPDADTRMGNMPLSFFS